MNQPNGKRRINDLEYHNKCDYQCLTNTSSRILYIGMTLEDLFERFISKIICLPQIRVLFLFLFVSDLCCS